MAATTTQLKPTTPTWLKPDSRLSNEATLPTVSLCTPLSDFSPPPLDFGAVANKDFNFVYFQHRRIFNIFNSLLLKVIIQGGIASELAQLGIKLHTEKLLFPELANRISNDIDTNLKLRETTLKVIKEWKNRFESLIYVFNKAKEVPEVETRVYKTKEKQKNDATKLLPKLEKLQKILNVAEQHIDSRNPTIEKHKAGFENRDSEKGFMATLTRFMQGASPPEATSSTGDADETNEAIPSTPLKTRTRAEESIPATVRLEEIKEFLAVPIINFSEDKHKDFEVVYNDLLNKWDQFSYYLVSGAIQPAVARELGDYGAKLAELDKKVFEAKPNSIKEHIQINQETYTEIIKVSTEWETILRSVIEKFKAAMKYEDTETCTNATLKKQKEDAIKLMNDVQTMLKMVETVQTHVTDRKPTIDKHVNNFMEAHQTL